MLVCFKVSMSTIPRSDSLAGFQRGGFQILGIFLQKLVGHVRHLTLRLCRLCGVMDAKGDDHLVFPQGNRVHDGGLDFFRHDGIIVLDHTDLRSSLDGNHPGQFQVIELFLETDAEILQILRCLGVLGKTGALGFLPFSSFSSVALTSSSFFFPAMIYMVSSLK